jgi:hypothetical protein
MSAARRLSPRTPEERIARAITAVRADLEPDPLYQRRLRSQVLGRYVAAREGVAVDARRPHREMGRLGRAVLYASFALGVSVTSVMAASQQAVPGDVLYPLKRDIEALRHRVLPDEFEAVLLRTELTARLDELAAVAEAGDPVLITALADEISETYDDVDELAPASPANLVVLNALLDTLPSDARAAVGDVAAKLEHEAGRPSPGHSADAPGRRWDPPAHGRDQGPGGTGAHKGPGITDANGGDPAASEAPTRPSTAGKPSPESSPGERGRGG